MTKYIITAKILMRCSIFLYQAEDGIRDHCVTGVQTCALPISGAEITAERLAVASFSYRLSLWLPNDAAEVWDRFYLSICETQFKRRESGAVLASSKIGRASCRERV